MKNQRLKTLTLSLLLAIAALSCGRKNDAKEQQKDAKQEYEHKKHIADSIVRANGFPEGGDAFRNKLRQLDDSIKSLEYKNSPLYAMETAVFNAGNKIAEKHTNILKDKLKKYNLNFNAEFVQKELSNAEFIMYGAYNDAGTSATQFYVQSYESAFNGAINAIVKSLGCDETQETRIAKIVKAGILSMCNEMYNSRKSIEGPFAKYFVGGMNAINRHCIQHVGDECWAEYCEAELNYTAMVTEETIHLYESTFNGDFFKDTLTANYWPLQAKNGKWYIVKEFPDGTKAQTEPFSHRNAYFESGTYPVCDPNQIPQVGAQTFRAFPGGNIGMHMEATRVTKVQKPSVQFPGSPELDKQIKQLQQELADLGACITALDTLEQYARTTATRIIENQK